MRHADIKLTLDRYGHLFPGSEAEAVARLRDAFRTVEVFQATGTHDSCPGAYSANYSAQGAFSDESGQDGGRAATGQVLERKSAQCCDSEQGDRPRLHKR